MSNFGTTLVPADVTAGSQSSMVLGHPSSGAMALRNLLRILTRRRNWIIGSIVCSLITAYLITRATKPTFESSATIELNKAGSTSLDAMIADSIGQQSGGGDSLGTDLQTETAILQNDTLALAVIKRLNLSAQSPFLEAVGGKPLPADVNLEQAPLTRARLLGVFHGMLRVLPVRGTRLIRVSIQSRDNQQAAQIANALIETYKSQYLESHYNATSEASDWLTGQLSQLKANVQDSEKKLTDFEKESGILNLPSENGSSGGESRSIVVQKLDAINSELTSAEANRIEKEAIYRLVKGGSVDVALGLGQDPMAVESQSAVLTKEGGLSNLEQLRQRQNQLKTAMAQAATIYGANNRHLKDMEMQDQSLQAQIRQEMNQIVRRAEGDFNLAKQTEQMIHARLDQQQAEVVKLNEKTVEFAVLSQEANSRKHLYEDLYTKLQEANISAGIKATDVTVVDPARAQANPISPKRTTNLALGLLFGILIGLGSAFTVDALDRTVVNPLEVEDLTSIPVIAVIPNFGATGSGYGNGYGSRRSSSARKHNLLGKQDSDSRKDAWIVQHPESMAAEAFRSLRTAILLSRPRSGARVFLVTSCVPGEGKSTVSANLAVAFAQFGKKVIIVEADMRRPTMGHVLSLKDHDGLSTVLAGGISLERAIQYGVQVPTLDVLASGPRPPMPSEMLGSGLFDELIEKLRETYDVVIIDSPPALLLADAVSIAPKSDATIWVCRAGVVTRPQLVRASQMIQRNSMPIIGFVLNGMDHKMDPYGYGYEYGYQYKTYRSTYGDTERDSDNA